MKYEALYNTAGLKDRFDRFLSSNSFGRILGRLRGTGGNLAGRDQRKFPRVPLSVKVTNLTSGYFSYYHAANISVGGMFLKSFEPPPVGTRLVLKFKLPTSSEDIVVAAEVMWSQPNYTDESRPAGMGIKFTEIDHKVRRVIKAFVDMKV